MEDIPEERYKSIVRKFHKLCQNEEIAQVLILEELQKQVDIVVEEVK